MAWGLISGTTTRTLATVLALAGATAAFASAPLALADDPSEVDNPQVTQPDACSVAAPKQLKKLYGSAVGQPEKFPLPTLPAGDTDMNHFLDMSQTACTYMRTPASGKVENVLHITVEQRNPEYSGGGTPWTPDDGYRTLIAIGASHKGNKGWCVRDNDKIAKQRHMPELAGDNIALIVTCKDKGKHAAQLGYQIGDDLWIVFSVIGSKQRPALDQVLTATKGVLAG